MRFVIILIVSLLSMVLPNALGKDFHLNLVRYSAKAYPVLIKLDVGSIFSVSLKSNPTTGYTWATYDQDLEKSGLLNVLKYLDQEYKQNPNPRGLLGVGGVSKLRFEVIGEGKGPLHLFYAQ